MASPLVLQKALQDAREGRLPEALAAVRFHVRRQPKDANALQVLSALLTMAGEPQQALHHLARAVVLEPRVPAFRHNYGNALTHARREAEAAAQYRAAVGIDPSYARAWVGLALALSACNDSDGAIAAAERGLRLQPNSVEFVRCYTTVLEAADRLDDTIRVLEEHIARNPRHLVLRSNHLFALNYTSRSRESIAEAHRDYGALVAKSAAVPAQRDADPTRPLRIGFLSGDLRTHSVGFFAEPLFQFKPANATFVVFNTATATPDDPMTRRFQAPTDEWIEVVAMDDPTLERTIRERRLDVLIELSGHTTGGRLQALDRKPAPMILSAIGYPNTTGHPAVDWRVVDSITDPAGAEEFCTERLLRLDPCFLCYQPPSDAPEPSLPREDAALTFGSFNLTSKVREETVALWAQVLAAVPGSRLLLKAKSLSDPGTRERILTRFAAGGIPRERVEMIAYTKSVAEHLALYGRVHVALDPTPYNGTTTTCEALWMGVPVITLAGDRHSARVGASLLTAAGRPEWVATDAAEYVAKAAALAADRAGLAEIRRTQRAALAASPLLDAAAYAARFYAAIRGSGVEA